MDLKNDNTKMTRRKIIGLISLIVFSLVFIFSCLKSVLPAGEWLVGTFGGLVYPMSFIFAFISLAIFLGFSYSKNPKPLALFVLALFSILLTIHSIDTYKGLDDVVRFNELKTYLEISYSKITIVGSFGSILCGLISIMLGGMGAIVTFVILATIFAGLFLDYELYGKYHEPHVKKLKSRKLREKVTNSDKNLKAGVPDYSFENQTNIAGEISVDARSYEENINDYSNTISNYEESEVAHEITAGQEYSYETGFNGYSSIEESQQTQNTFDSEFYKEESIPDIYSKPASDYSSQRAFMNATFSGNSSSQNEEQPTEDFNYGNFGGFNTGFTMQNDEPDESSIVSDVNYTGDGLSTETEPVLDDFNQILNTADDEFNLGESETFASEPFNFGGLSNVTPVEQPVQRFEPEYIQPTQPVIEPQNPFGNQTSSPFGNTRYGAGFNPADIETSVYERPQQTFRPEPQPVPVREIKQTPMRGVRYNAPTLSLLKTPVPDTGDYTAEQNRKTMILENSLEAFKVPAKVKNIVRGPKITRYELSVPLGISVKKIPMFENDIAAALAAKTITIKAPIPGSNYVGIELENDTFTTVYQRELLESDAFQKCKDPLAIAIGKDISGEIVVKSLVDMVHVLIAGSTGSGKSVFIHNVVLSLLYKHSPDDLRLIMIDPKKVEFPIYNGLPHLLTPEVVAGSQKAISALKWCVKEMDRRYDLMAKAGFRDIKPYNKSDLVKAGQFEKLPYIVIIVDELAEIMQADKKNAEGYIQRITQLARACGMHMVLATQRPSVDIITGVIKNNIPSRIAFSLQSGIDSKTIINTVGAEKLLGRGDMIFYPTGTSAMPRLQASYASDEEIKSVIDYVIKNNDANYDESVERDMNQDPSEPDSVGGFNGGDGVPPQRESVDEYFRTAVKLVMQNGGASTSYLQRRLSIGYSRAARIMDQMSDKGYIAPSNGSKLRKILITPEQFKEEFGVDYDAID